MPKRSARCLECGAKHERIVRCTPRCFANHDGDGGADNVCFCFEGGWSDGVAFAINMMSSLFREAGQPWVASQLEDAADARKWEW